MRTRSLVPVLAATLTLLAGSSAGLAQVGTAITYQGQLKDNGLPRTAPVDLQFKLFDSEIGGAQVGGTVVQTEVQPAAGLFSANIDFGVDPYTTDHELFLEIGVRDAGDDSFTLLTRQRVTAAPFSLATRGLNVSAGGNVGIGTQTPRVKFDLTGRSRLAGATQIAGNGSSSLFVGGNDNGALIFPAGATVSDKLGVRIYNDFGGAGASKIQCWDYNSNSPRTLTINPDGGNIGIGTEAPQVKLDLLGRSRLAGATQIAGLGGSSLFVGGGDSGTLTFPAGSPSTDRFGIRIYNDLLASGASKIQSWDYNSNTARLLTLNPDGGNVGIGTSAPQVRFDLSGRSRLAGATQIAGSGSTSLFVAGNDTGAVTFPPGATVSDMIGVRIYNDAGLSGASKIQCWDYTTNTARLLTINPDGGNVAIGGGGVSTSFKLDVFGSIHCISLTQASCRDLKQDISPFSGGLEAIMKLNPVSYSWNDKAPEQVRGSRDIGFIADEMNEVLPDLVAKDAGGKPIGIDYGKITPVTVEAIKELKKENDQMKADNADLKARLARIEALLAAQARK